MKGVKKSIHPYLDEKSSASVENIADLARRRELRCEADHPDADKVIPVRREPIFFIYLYVVEPLPPHFSLCILRQIVLDLLEGRLSRLEDVGLAEELDEFWHLALEKVGRRPVDVAKDMDNWDDLVHLVNELKVLLVDVGTEDLVVEDKEARKAEETQALVGLARTPDPVLEVLKVVFDVDRHFLAQGEVLCHVDQTVNVEKELDAVLANQFCLNKRTKRICLYLIDGSIQHAALDALEHLLNQTQLALLGLEAARVVADEGNHTGQKKKFFFCLH